MELFNKLKCIILGHNYSVWNETTINYFDDGSSQHITEGIYSKCECCNNKKSIKIKTKVNHVFKDLDCPEIDYSKMLYGDDNNLLISQCNFDEVVVIDNPAKFNSVIIENNIFPAIQIINVNNIDFPIVKKEE